MRRFLSFLGLVLGAVTLAACDSGETPEVPLAGDVLVSNVNVVDVETDTVLPAQDVVISGDRISFVGVHGDKAVDAAVVVDGNGKYLIPGLWDMHAHIRSYQHQDILPMFISHGVTGLRDLGITNHALIKRWKTEISNGDIIGPRIITSGVIIEGAEPRFPSSVSISTLEEVEPKIDALIADGVDIIKLFQNIPGDVFAAIVAYAHENGLVTSGHIPTGWTQYQAAESGLDSIEHMFAVGDTLPGYAENNISEANLDRLAETLIASNTYHSPTMVNLEYFVKLGNAADDKADEQALFENAPVLAEAPAYFRAWWKAIRARNVEAFTQAQYARFRERLALNGQIINGLHNRGVKILAGTDVPNPYIIAGTSLHDELELYVKAGMRPMDSLKTATLYPAQYFGRSNDLGVVKQGAFADLVLLNANPIDDINNVRDVTAVFANGRLFNANDLNDIRSDQRRRFAKRVPTDFDQFIYMDVRRNGIEAVKAKHPEPRNSTDYSIEPVHLLRLSDALQEGLKPQEAIAALKWNLELFPDDAATRKAFEELSQTNKINETQRGD